MNEEQPFKAMTEDQMYLDTRQLDFPNTQLCIPDNYLIPWVTSYSPFPHKSHSLELQPCYALLSWLWLWTSSFTSRIVLYFLSPLWRSTLTTQLGLAGAPTSSLDASLREGLILGFTRLRLAFVMALPTLIPLILILANHSHWQR